MMGSTFMTWFGVIVSMASSTPGGSTPPPIWSGRGCPPLPPLARWPVGTVCRCVRHAATWSRPWLLDGWRFPRPTWCSPSSCRARWPIRCANTPASGRHLVVGGGASTVGVPAAGWSGEAFGRMNGRAVQLEGVFDRYAQADLSAAYAILVPQRRVRVPTKPGEGGPPDGQRGDLRPGVVGPAEKGPDDRLAD